MSTNEPEARCLTFHLLDSAQGHPLQTWHFEDVSRVTIGRAPDSHVRLTDGRVSRLHVELLDRNGEWLLCSHGRNGTLINGENVTEATVAPGTIFQLGPNGPTLRFNTSEEHSSALATISQMPSDVLDFLMIDEVRKDHEVRHIIESETFRDLQEQVRRLKEGRLAQSDNVLSSPNPEEAT